MLPFAFPPVCEIGIPHILALDVCNTTMKMLVPVPVAMSGTSIFIREHYRYRMHPGATDQPVVHNLPSMQTLWAILP